jgi:hypothetical protein
MSCTFYLQHLQLLVALSGCDPKVREHLLCSVFYVITPSIFLALGGHVLIFLLSRLARSVRAGVWRVAGTPSLGTITPRQGRQLGLSWAAWDMWSPSLWKATVSVQPEDQHKTTGTGE